MKTSLKVASIVLATFAVGAAIFMAYLTWALDVAFGDFNDETWSVENRTILEEVFSPDSTRKIGFYHYDAGAFGYTTVCVSLVEAGETYPVEPNVLKVANWAVDTVAWRGSKEVLFRVRPGYGSTREAGATPSPVHRADVLVKFEPSNAQP